MLDNKITLFKNGVLSQWHLCTFNINGIDFNCAEQFMMYSKALLFKDDEVAKKILNTPIPHDQKTLGRSIKNYNDKTWNQFREDIVFDGNFAKFFQNKDLKKFLLNTKDTIIAEASVQDRVWGIGLSEDNPKAQNIHLWKGRNLLGTALMKVRSALNKPLN